MSTGTTTTTTTATTMMDYYDIAMRAPVAETCCSVNPWKARLALNFKAAPYKTHWVSLPDIPKTRTSLGVAPCRKHASGAEYPTLPVLIDHATGSKIGDSFEIAVYLQKQYPTSGAGNLFPQDVSEIGYTYGQELAPWMPPLSERNEEPEYDDYSRFNREVDLAFTTHVGLMGYFLPLENEAAKKVFLDRAGLQSWEQIGVHGEVRQGLLNGFWAMLNDMARIFKRRDQGPFILGDRATYADLCLGGWLFMASRTLPKEEWEQVITGNDRVYGRLFETLGKWAEVK
ncbi:uncharacterized protein B0I36DRAFT_331851 [Microdochium trichocladiopsis]|uniref:GST N-terminal domain-containing protein n=1 Tax=Microdochium trichocladiopsis TaxID=1682393 RepID=A0A9P8XY24_9PEZI|nr:uncharacterized protein B0I36DRAFT_331851 [Microdochium trichocladiopsis]KAH7024679.1 hypothetical protein B0I36DRAFT_331851 [Microdochium trichocladiopsis]